MIHRPLLLYITQVFPYPADSGGKIKSLNSILTLAKKYRVFLVCVSEKKPSASEVAFLTEQGITCRVFYNPEISQSIEKTPGLVIKNYLHGRPHYIFQYTYLPAQAFITEWVRKNQPNIIHIDHLNIAQYLPSEIYRSSKQTWILEHHNIESQLLWTRFWYSPWRRWKRKIYLFFEATFTWRFEMRYLHLFDHVFAISELDQARLRKFFGVQRVSTQHLVYPLSPNHSLARPLKSNQSPHILFVGGLGWPPNQDAVEWFISHVLPLVVKKVPDLTFDVVGHWIGHLDKKVAVNPHVIFHGFQKDLIPFLKQATLFVLPFRMGGGIRIKALTAMSHSLPLVTTPLGIEGLNLKNQHDCLVTSNPDTFAKACIKVLTQTKLRQKLQQSGSQYLKKFHSEKENQLFLHRYQEAITLKSQ